MPERPTVLTIEMQDSGQATAMLDNGSYDGGQRKYTYSFEMDTLRQLIDRQTAAIRDNNLAEAQQVGGILMQILIPKEIRAGLPANGSMLLLSTNEHDIPWELLWDEDFLGIRYAMGRQWLTAGDIRAARPPANKAGKRCLLLTNPTEDLPEAQQEASQLMRYFRQHHFACTLLAGRHVTAADVLVQLGTGLYDIVHYSGHIDTDDQGAYLRLAQGGRFYLKEVLHLDDMGRPFLFINGCGPVQGGSASIVTPLIYAGGGPILCTTMPVSDAGSRQFSECVVSHVLAGMTYGQATMEARRQFFQKPGASLDWMCFTYYGNPLDVMPLSAAGADAPPPPAPQKTDSAPKLVPGAPTRGLKRVLGRADSLTNDIFVISTSHLFASLLMENDDEILAAFEKSNAKTQDVQAIIAAVFDIPANPKMRPMPPAERYSENARLAGERACDAAKEESRPCTPADLCRALLSKPNMLTEILEKLGIDSTELLRQL